MRAKAKIDQLRRHFTEEQFKNDLILGYFLQRLTLKYVFTHTSDLLEMCSDMKLVRETGRPVEE